VADLARREVATTAELRDFRPPYDEGATGIVPGEAAAAMVLVRGSGGARLPLVSSVSAMDPDPLASGEPRPQRLAQVAALVCRGESVIDGAGYGRPELDLVERRSLAEVVPAAAHLLATRAAFGSLGAAGPIVQAIAATGVLRRGALPPIAGLVRAADGPLQPIAVATRTLEKSALLLSGGAPGAAAAIRVEVP
jgi:3-oxoacyl-(acyl-carrier-protein) synthase